MWVYCQINVFFIFLLKNPKVALGVIVLSLMKVAPRNSQSYLHRQKSHLKPVSESSHPSPSLQDSPKVTSTILTPKWLAVKDGLRFQAKNRNWKQNGKKKRKRKTNPKTQCEKERKRRKKKKKRKEENPSPELCRRVHWSELWLPRIGWGGGLIGVVGQRGWSVKRYAWFGNGEEFLWVRFLVWRKKLLVGT